MLNIVRLTFKELEIDFTTTTRDLYKKLIEKKFINKVDCLNGSFSFSHGRIIIVNGDKLIVIEGV